MNDAYDLVVYVHYFKTRRILEGSFRDFLDSVSVEKSEKKNTIELTLDSFSTC